MQKFGVEVLIIFRCLYEVCQCYNDFLLNDLDFKLQGKKSKKGRKNDNKLVKKGKFYEF